MKADILYEALAAMNAVLEADHEDKLLLPKGVYMQLFRAKSSLNAALKVANLEVEVTQ